MHRNIEVLLLGLGENNQGNDQPVEELQQIDNDQPADVASGTGKT